MIDVRNHCCQLSEMRDIFVEIIMDVFIVIIVIFIDGVNVGIITSCGVLFNRVIFTTSVSLSHGKSLIIKMKVRI